MSLDPDPAKSLERWSGGCTSDEDEEEEKVEGEGDEDDGNDSEDAADEILSCCLS